MTAPSGWLLWALLSACFAALTAIFAKVGIRGVDSDLADKVRRTVFIPCLKVSSSLFLCVSNINPATWRSLMIHFKRKGSNSPSHCFS